MISAINQAYYERNKLVRFLASLYPSGTKKTAIEGWEPEWHNCVYIDTPAGQMSWHYHDRDASLFSSLPTYHGDWDGHTTLQKYLRLEKLTFKLRDDESERLKGQIDVRDAVISKLSETVAELRPLLARAADALEEEVTMGTLTPKMPEYAEKLAIVAELREAAK